MPLAIRFGEVRTADEPSSWVVYLDHLSRDGGRAVLWGFARRTDAEIALRVLPETGIDWSAPEPELRRQWYEYGGREAVKRYVCERLQW